MRVTSFPSRLWLCAAASACLADCAAIPKLPAAPSPKPVAAYASAVQFSAPAGQWPGDRWWRDYRDPQLSGLIEEALADAPSLAQAAARVRLAEAAVQGAASTLGPHVTGVLSGAETRLNNRNGIPAGFVPHGWRDAWLVGAGLDWQIDFFGKNRAILASATSEAEAARVEQAAARLTLSTGIAATYAELARLYADRDAAEDAVRLRWESEALILRRRDEGVENDTAAERAHAERARAEEELAALDERIGLTRDALAALAGQGPDRGLALSRPAPGAIRAFGLPAHLAAELLGRRPDIVAARLVADAASRRIDAARADFYPNVNLTAFLGAQSIGLNMLAKSGARMGSVGPAITLPIFESGRLQGAYRAARAEYDGAVATYDETLTRALREVADAAVSARALGGRLASSREAEAAAAASLRLAQKRYAQGLCTYLDVLGAEDTLISARRVSADLATRAFALDVALVRALGGGFAA